MALDLSAINAQVQQLWTAFRGNPTLPNDATKFLDGTGAFSVPGGGLVLAGKNTVEVSSTSGTPNTALSVVSSLSIPVTKPFIVQCSIRTDGSQISVVSWGIQINSTVVLDTGTGTSRFNTTATASVTTGMITFSFGPQSTNYLRALVATAAFVTGGTAATRTLPAATDTPKATITSITILGQDVTGLGETYAASDVFVWTLPTS